MSENTHHLSGRKSNNAKPKSEHKSKRINLPVTEAEYARFQQAVESAKAPSPTKFLREHFVKHGLI